MQKNFELAVWTHGAVEKAKEAADETHTVEEMTKIFVYAAKNQVSLWGPRGEINDYSAREWSKLTGEYYYGRWELYFDMLFNALSKNETINMNDYHRMAIAWGREWNDRVSIYLPFLWVVLYYKQPDLYEIHHQNPTKTIEKLNNEFFVASLEKFLVIEGMTMEYESMYVEAHQQDPRM